MKRLIATGLATGILVGCTTTEPTSQSSRTGGPEPAPATVTITNLVSTLAFSQYVSCANGGLGEEVIISGRLHETLHVTLTPKGNAQIKLHFQPQNASGTGQTTGMTWVANGVTQETVTARLVTTGGASSTFVNNFRLIGPGPGNNLVVHYVRHVTINANGTITVETGIVPPSVDCGREGT